MIRTQQGQSIVELHDQTEHLISMIPSSLMFLGNVNVFKPYQIGQFRPLFSLFIQLTENKNC